MTRKRNAHACRECNISGLRRKDGSLYYRHTRTMIHNGVTVDVRCFNCSDDGLILDDEGQLRIHRTGLTHDCLMGEREHPKTEKAPEPEIPTDRCPRCGDLGPGPSHNCGRDETPPTETATDPLATAIADAVKPHLTDILNTDELRDRVTAIAHDVLRDAQGTVSVTLTKPDQPDIDVGVQHKDFALLAKLLAARQNVYLWGPPGWGKSTAPATWAKAAGLDFYPMSMGPSSLEHSIVGYADANGNLVETSFYKAFRHGGLWLADEMDNCNPDALVRLNSALEQGYCDFPAVGLITAHVDFTAVGGGNTIGLGGNIDHPGRAKMDSALRSRFAFLRWGEDEGLEDAIARGFEDASDAPENVREWLRHVRAVRHTVETLQLREIATGMRCTVQGAKLLNAGLTLDEAKRMVYKDRIDADTYGKITEAVGG